MGSVLASTLGTLPNYKTDPSLGNPSIDSSSFELKSKLLVSPLKSPIVVP